MKRNLIIYILIICSVQAAGQNAPGKLTLSNGVEISDTWPPDRNKETERKEMPVPYLEKRQELIPINVGRQLFVDDFLIKSTNLVPVCHTPKYSNKNPVLKPDKEWESNSEGFMYAAPFSDGIWFDEKDQKFKMWYLAGAPGKGLRSYYTCYAESDNGIKWIKPNLGIFGSTNIVDTLNRDASTIWLDKKESDPSKRFKMFCIVPDWHYVYKYSADGINWSKMITKSGRIKGDRSTAFYNPFKNKWALSIKITTPVSSRSRSYAENKDPELLLKSVNRFNGNYREILDENVVFWFTPDDKEPRHPKFPEIDPAIYNFDAIAYESLMLGFFSVWQGPENNTCKNLGIHKRNEVLIGYSRDGFHFSRPSHKPFMGVNETDGAWNWGNVQSIIGTPIMMGDSLYFYVSGRMLNSTFWDSQLSTGLATLRRDGFVSMEPQVKQGYLLTQKICFDGNYLFVNADIPKGGELRVEILDENNKAINGYGKADCIPMKENSTKYMMRWKSHDNISELKNKPIHFRFYINKGAIYSFCVSPWITGESRGHTAGGGPGLSQTGVDDKNK